MRVRILLIAAILLIVPSAFAGTYSLNDWCFYVNSLDVNRSCNTGSGVDNFTPQVSPGTFDYVHLQDGNNTLGTVVVTLGPGSYNVFAIYNYDIGMDGGKNEFATVFGSLPIGQVYAIDAQGASGSTPGQLYSQFAGGSLSNTNYLPSCNGSDCPDVAVSMGFTNLVVPAGQTATINFIVSDTPPTSGGYIQQSQNGDPSTINFSSTLQTSSNFAANVVANPEPTTCVLLGGGLGLILIGARRRKKV